MRLYLKLTLLVAIAYAADSYCLKPFRVANTLNSENQKSLIGLAIPYDAR
jgi:hypothetical protein